jgi:uncharacterized OB-fold protein
MQEDALEKLQAGVTTLEEVVRVVPVEALPATGCEKCGHELPPTYRFCSYCGAPSGSGNSDFPPRASLRMSEGVLS